MYKYFISFIIIIIILSVYWFISNCPEITAHLHAIYGVLFEWDFGGLPGASSAGDT